MSLLALRAAHLGSTVAPVLPPPVDPGGGTGSMPTKPAPDLSTAGAVTVGFSTNLQTLVNSNPAGTVYYFPNGTYTGVAYVRPKAGDRFIGESEAGVIIQGTTSNKMAFRTRENNITWARMTFQGFGVKSTDLSQDTGIIDLHDEATATNEYVAWWVRANKAEDCHIAEVTIKDSGNMGVYIGHRTLITDSSFYELSPQGVGGGGGVGGMIHSNYFEECGLIGAAGAGANKAAIKITWHNIGPWGDTSKDMTPHFAAGGGSGVADAPTETLKIVNNVFEGNDNNSAERAVWFDLDVRDTEVSYNDFQNLNGAGIFYEGCNGGWVHHNTFNDCGNLGAINFSGGFNTGFSSKYMSYGAMTTGASDNILVEDNDFIDCAVTLLFFNGDRFTAPSDWIDPGYPVIPDGRMSSGFAPLAVGDRSGGGAANGTARNNTCTGSCDHFGVWFHPNIQSNEGNIGTYLFSGNTYPAGASKFVWGRTFQTQAQWAAAGRA